MFIKKRKITKASIDELAKRYPQEIISDEDAENIVGGVHYYSASGAYLGQIGDSSELRILSDPSAFFASSVTGALDECNNPAYNSSTSFASSSLLAQTSVMRGMLQSYGFTGSVALNSSNNANNLGYYDHQFQITTIYTSSKSFISGNTIELRMIAKHEAMHSMQNTGIITQNDREIEAYGAMIDDPDFYKCSPEFVDKILRKYKDIGGR